MRCLDVKKIKLKVHTLPGRPGGGAMGRGHRTGGGAIGLGAGHRTGVGAIEQRDAFLCRGMDSSRSNMSVCL